MTGIFICTCPFWACLLLHNYTHVHIVAWNSVRLRRWASTNNIKHIQYWRIANGIPTSWALQNVDCRQILSCRASGISQRKLWTWEIHFHTSYLSLSLASKHLQQGVVFGCVHDGCVSCFIRYVGVDSTARQTSSPFTESLVNDYSQIEIQYTARKTCVAASSVPPVIDWTLTQRMDDWRWLAYSNSLVMRPSSWHNVVSAGESKAI